MQRPRFPVTVSRVADDQILHFLSGLRANSQSFLSKNTRSGSPSLAAARVTLLRHGPTQTRSHSGPARAARRTYCDPSHSSRTAASPAHHSPRPESFRLTHPGPSHSQRPAVHHSPQPASLAAARVRVTRSGPPSPAAGRRGPSR